MVVKTLTQKEVDQILNKWQPYIRIAPDHSDLRLQEGIIGATATPRLPNINGKIVPKDALLRELYVDGHKIFDEWHRPNKEILGEVDEKTGKQIVIGYEEVARVAFPFQHLIATAIRVALTGNPIEIEYVSGGEGSMERNKDLFVEFKQQFLGKNMDVAFSQCVWGQYTTGDTALYLYRKDGKLDWQVFGYEQGDVLVPEYDQYGYISRFIRYYALNNEEHIDIFTNTRVDTYKKSKVDSDAISKESGWEWVSGADHGFSRVPICYKKGKVAWDNVQNQIDQFEKSFSDLCEANAYYANEILFVKGSLEFMPRKRNQGKIIVGETPETEANFLKRNESNNTQDLELRTLLEQIFRGAYTTIITPENIKANSDMSGTAIKMIKSHEHDFGITQAADWDDFIDSMMQLFKEGIGLELKKPANYSRLVVRGMIKVYTPQNDAELVNMVNASVSMGSISKETAAEVNPLAKGDETDRIEKQEKAELYAPAQNNLNDGMNQHNQAVALNTKLK